MRAHTRGFTLIELLAVIAIVSLLAGLLWPVIGLAREEGQRVKCLSNLRQMAIAANAYTVDHGGYFPKAYYTDDQGREHCWDYTTLSDGTLVAGDMWEGFGNERIYQCPGYHGSSNTRHDPYTGYNYNTSYIGHGERERPYQKAARSSMVMHPANTALFGDGEYGEGANKYMRAPFSDIEGYGDRFGARYAGTQGFRHRKRTNVVFCDGSARSLRECYTETERGGENIGEGCGFLSPDNSLYDLK